MRKILGLLVLISGMALGQEMDTLALDTAKKVPKYYGGVYVDAGVKLAPNPPGANLTQFIGAGFQYNKWSLGFLVNDFKGTTQQFLAFPRVRNLKYRYGGPFVSYSFLKTYWIDFIGQASISKGDMTWRNSDDGQDFLRSKFNMFMLSAKLEVIRLRFVRPYLNIGYQQMSQLKHTNVEEEDFSGLFFGVGVCLGYFNQ